MTSDLQLLQFIAYTSLTIAAVSATFGYRNNYGWPPISIITAHGLAGIGGSKVYNATLKFELWNRRKYPVAITSTSVRFAKMEFKQPADGSGWHRSGDAFYQRDEARLEPGAYKQFSFAAPFTTDSLDAIDDEVSVTVNYFDPISSKYRSITQNARYKLS
jgi:hypothetical protein